MIQANNSLDKEIISYLQEYDPGVAEYRAFFRYIGLEPSARTS